jgi:hypothetical protein
MDASDRGRAEFERLERLWADAVVQQDRVALEHILAPEYELIISAAPERPVPRATWIEQATGPYRVRGYTITNLVIRLVTDDVAAVSLTLTTEASVGGVDRSVTFFIVDLWQRTGGVWRVVQRYSALPEASSASSRAVTGE